MSFPEIASYLTNIFGATFYVVPGAKAVSFEKKLLITDIGAIPIRARFTTKRPLAWQEADSATMYGGGKRGPESEDKTLLIADLDYDAITVDDKIIEPNGNNYTVVKIWEERVNDEVAYRYVDCRPIQTQNTRY